MRSEQIKILEIGPYPPPYSGWGVRIKYVAEQLREQGCECQILNLGRNRLQESSEYITVKSGFDYLTKVFRHVRNGYLVHMHANGDSPKGFVLTIIGLSLAFVFGKRAVLTFHAGPDQLYFPLKNKLNKFLFPIFYFIFALPRRIICNCEEVKDKIIEYKISADKIVPIPAFSIQYLNFGAVTYDDDLHKFLESHHPIILSYIMFRPEFYYESIFHCISFLKSIYTNLGLLIIGGLPDNSNNNYIYNLLQKYNINKITLFAGNVDHDHFMNIIKDIDIYLRSASTEGVSASILESLYLKTPVVANTNSLHHNNVIQYTINDAHDMYQKISHTLNHLQEVKENMQDIYIRDTVQEEADLLIRNFSTADLKNFLSTNHTNLHK